MNKNPDTWPSESANNIGVAGKVNSNSWWGEGGIVSRFANRIPGINAVAGMHDVFQIMLDRLDIRPARDIGNIPGMPVAGVVTYTGLLDGSMGTALRVSLR